MFYPLSGQLRGNESVDCTDRGALYLETKVNVPISEIAKNQEKEFLYKLFPFDPYSLETDQEAFLTGVQVNFFSCGGVGIGVCTSHKIADGSTASSFLNTWAAIANGTEETQAPWMDGATIFPPKGTKAVDAATVQVVTDKFAIKRFVFSDKNLSILKAKIGNAYNATRVEALTALIWKSAMEAARINLGMETLPPSAATHIVSIRKMMNPPLPENAMGNLFRVAAATYVDGKRDVGLDELIGLFRRKILDIKNEFVNYKLEEGEKLPHKITETLKELGEFAGVKERRLYLFTSWTRFPLHMLDFGWGKPIKVCTLMMPLGNCIILMSTGSGDGIEALISLNEEEMKDFETNTELLQFISTT